MYIFYKVSKLIYNTCTKETNVSAHLIEMLPHNQVFVLIYKNVVIVKNKVIQTFWFVKPFTLRKQELETAVQMSALGLC